MALEQTVTVWQEVAASLIELAHPTSQRAHKDKTRRSAVTPTFVAAFPKHLLHDLQAKRVIVHNQQAQACWEALPVSTGVSWVLLEFHALGVHGSELSLQNATRGSQGMPSGMPVHIVNLRPKQRPFAQRGRARVWSPTVGMPLSVSARVFLLVLKHLIYQMCV